MKPGDLIEWVYEPENVLVRANEHMWSSMMKAWVHIGGVHLLISRAEGTLTWLPLGAFDKGLLRARADDTWRQRSQTTRTAVAPRSVE